MKRETLLVHLGRGPRQAEGPVNVPVHRASTIVSPDLDSYLGRFEGDRRYHGITYGASGTQNARALAETVAGIEGGAGTVVTSTGKSAVTLAISAFVSAGDHLLVSDSVYGPTRSFCTELLSRYGVEATFYDPGIGADIGALVRENTRLIFLEAPGSLTFEMQDVPAIARVARARGVVTAMDNTWATPLAFRPFEHGVDISIQAGTKYFAGHSDLVIGLITAASDEHYRRVFDQARLFGDVASPDDCFLTLRGMRTMAVRMERQFASALAVAGWLERHDAVRQVLFPPLESDPGHALWQRDFDGGASLFGVALATHDLDAVRRLVDGLELFSIGSSWGGFESLIAMNRMPVKRDVVSWTSDPFLLRLHIGLEHPDDLIADLAAGFERLG